MTALERTYDLRQGCLGNSDTLTLATTDTTDKVVSNCEGDQPDSSVENNEPLVLIVCEIPKTAIIILAM